MRHHATAGKLILEVKLREKKQQPEVNETFKKSDSKLLLHSPRKNSLTTSTALSYLNNSEQQNEDDQQDQEEQ